MLKLPKCLESDEKGPQIIEALSLKPRKLWPGGVVEVPEKELSEPLIKALSFARRCGKLRGGLENTQTMLQKEEAGLVALTSRGLPPQSERITRLILMSNDGSDRFYKSCEQLLLRYKSRVFGIYLNASAGEIGSKFFGKDKAVKLMMVEHRDFVSRALLSFVE